MKKLFAVLFSALIILSSFSLVAFAEDVAHISVADVTVNSEETVEMPVKMSNNKGIWGLVFNIHFDTKAFQVKEVRSTGEVFNKSDIMIGPADFNDGYVRVVVTPADVMNNNTKNGTICTIILEQTDYTVDTTYPFTFEYEGNDFINIDGEIVSVSSTDGSVSVIDNADKTTSNKKENKPDKSTNKNDDLGDVIAEAEDNKIIDNYTETETATEVDNKETAENVVEKNDSVEIDKEDEGTAQAIGSTGNAPVFSFYILGILIIAAIVVLVVVLVKKFSKK